MMEFVESERRLGLGEQLRMRELEEVGQEKKDLVKGQVEEMVLLSFVWLHLSVVLWFHSMHFSA